MWRVPDGSSVYSTETIRARRSLLSGFRPTAGLFVSDGEIGPTAKAVAKALGVTFWGRDSSYRQAPFRLPHSWTPQSEWPCRRMTTWGPIGHSAHRLPEVGGDTGGKRVTADIGQVFPEQVRRSYGIAGGRGADHLDVVALPAHLPASGFLGRRSLDCAEIGNCEPEGGIGSHREFQRRSGSAAVGGPLSLPIPRRRPTVCRDCTTVLLDGRHSVSQLWRVFRFLTSGVLHGRHRVPMV